MLQAYLIKQTYFSSFGVYPCWCLDAQQTKPMPYVNSTPASEWGHLFCLGGTAVQKECYLQTMWPQGSQTWEQVSKRWHCFCFLGLTPSWWMEEEQCPVHSSTRRLCLAPRSSKEDCQVLWWKFGRHGAKQLSLWIRFVRVQALWPKLHKGLFWSQNVLN